MKTAKDYPVTFPFGATTDPYTVINPHKGDDRSMPYRTEVKVNGTLIGYAGSTGNSTGVHTHTQKVLAGVVSDPKGQGFDVSLPATVTATGYKQDTGNFVRYTDSQGVVWSVFHLDEIKCKVGDKIGVYMSKIDDLRIIASEVEGFDMTKTHTGQFDKILTDAWGSKPIEEYIRHAWSVQKKHRGHLQGTIDSQTAQISLLQAEIADLKKNSCTTQERQYLTLLKEVSK